MSHSFFEEGFELGHLITDLGYNFVAIYLINS